MNHSEIEGLFQALHLDSDDERAAMRFNYGMMEAPLPVQVFTTNTTLCQESVTELRENA